MRHSILRWLTIGTLPLLFLFSAPVDAATFPFDCGSSEDRNLNRPRRLVFRIENTGDCAFHLEAFSLSDLQGETLLDLTLAPGEEADVICPNPRARSARLVVDGGGTTGAVIRTSPLSTAKDHVGGFAGSGGYTILHLSDSATPATRAFHYGRAQTGFTGIFGLSGDFDGDGLDTVASIDLRTFECKLAATNTTGDPFLTTFRFPDLNPPGDGAFLWPLTGDFDGDGVDTVAFYDSQQTAFLLKNSNDGSPVDVVVPFGGSGVFPVVGDFDGDGTDTIGVYDPANQRFSLRNTNAPGPADLTFRFLLASGLPLFGDFDGDGTDTPAIYSADTVSFLIRNSNTTGNAEEVRPLASRALSFTPLIGRWDLHGDLEEHTGHAWATASLASQNIDPVLLDAAYADAALDPDLHSLLVIRNGFLVREAYFNGFDGSMGNNVKSVSKSVLSALVGLALADGSIASTETTLASILPEVFAGQEPGKQTIDITHLVTMSAGLGWTEGNLASWINSSDWVTHVIDRPLVANPGQTFLYSTGLTHVGSAVVTRATGMPTSQYAEQALFGPLGISVTRWDRDPDGNDIGGAEVYMRPRDMARFGELYRNGGTIDGTPILDPAWVASTTAPIFTTGGYTYGGWWWQDSFAGQDAFFAWGYGGQFIFVFEALNLVVVTTSSWNVNQAAANAQYQDVFNLLSQAVLPAVTP